MTIITIGTNHYIAVKDGLQPITSAQMMELYESGQVTNEEVLNYD